MRKLQLNASCARRSAKASHKLIGVNLAQLGRVLLGGKVMPEPSVLAELRFQRLQYAQEMLRELCVIAKSDRHPLLGYLIEMAYLEASDQLREMHASQGDRPRQAA
jgi:hypothetical protein